MGNPDFGYQLNPAYSIPARRLREKYLLEIANYISRVTDVGRNEQEGFWFATDKSQQLVANLLNTNALFTTIGPIFFKPSQPQRPRAKGIVRYRTKACISR